MTSRTARLLAQYSIARQGMEAMYDENWTRAIELFTTAVKAAPHALTFRLCLRASERKRLSGIRKLSLFSKWKLSRVRSRIEKARKSGDWPEVDLLAEQGLAVNPWDSEFHADLGKSASQRGYLNVAEFAYKQATGPDGDPKNKEFLCQLRDLYVRQHKTDAAIATNDRLLHLDD